ncbi:MAG TPA: DUF3999 domain-containing protein [Burkholderiales bacterium]|nr:DUF3999 domain-containing protein [Burkholderiales bacterium]
MKALALVTVALALPAMAEERPGDFNYSAAISAEAAASHYRVTLPAEAYRGAARRDLGDVRIFNAAGEPVPYAFAPRELPRGRATVQSVRIFPLYGDESKGLEGTTVRVARSARGSVLGVSVTEQAAPARRRLLGYVLDPGETRLPKDALLLDWDSAEGFSGHAQVEGTDDFKQWHSVVTGAPILALQHDGASLERSRVELGGSRARYLRLALNGVPRGFALKQVRLELRPETPQVTRAWLTLAGVAGKANGEWLFDSGGHFPADRVRLQLPEPNTVAQVQLMTRERADDRWRPAASGIAYRLAGEAGDVVNPEITASSNSDRYWMLKVDQKGGGLGTGEVRLEIGWLPHEIVFAARGASPFTLAYGNGKAGPGAVPLAVVLPLRSDGTTPSATPAALGAIAARAETSFAAQPLRFVRELTEQRDVRKWLLWSALVAGVLLLGWMAARLLRDMGKSS